MEGSSESKRNKHPIRNKRRRSPLLIELPSAPLAPVTNDHSPNTNDTPFDLDPVKIEIVDEQSWMANPQTSSPKHSPTNDPTKKRKWTHVNWDKVCEFQNHAEQDAFFQAENFWRKRGTRTGSDGTKTVYYCSQVRKKGPPCPAMVQIRYRNDSHASELYHNNMGHQHNGCKGNRVDRTSKLFQKILDLFL